MLEETAVTGQGTQTDAVAAAPEVQPDKQPEQHPDGGNGQKPVSVPMERLDREIKKRKALEAEATAARIEAARLQGMLEARKEQAVPAASSEPAKPADVRPKSEDFQTYEEFTEALTDWKARKVYEESSRKQRETQEAESKKNTEMDAYNKYRAELKVKSDAALAKFPDFYDRAREPGVVLPDPLVKVLLQSNKYAEITYHLASNPEKSAALANLMAMNPHAASMEIGRMEAAFSTQPVARKASGAPEPVIPLVPSGGGNEDREETTEEYIRRRNREDAERRAKAGRRR